MHVTSASGELGATNHSRKLLGGSMHAATNEVPVHGWNQSSGEITRNLDEKSAVGKKQNGWKRMNK